MSQKIRVCLVHVFENCFMFSKIRRTKKTWKTRFVSTVFSIYCFLLIKNKENKENMENTFSSHSFEKHKNLENTKLRKQERFSENNKMVFFVFSSNVKGLPKKRKKKQGLKPRGSLAR